MALRREPDRDEVQKDLASLIALAYRSLEIGVPKSLTLLREAQLGYEDSAHASLVRLYLKSQFRASAQDTHLADLSNAGVLLLHPHLLVPKYRVRVLKSHNGEPPASGDSKLLLAFCNQQISWQLPLPWPFSPLQSGDEADTEQPINLILHWQFRQDRGLTRVMLACPRYATPYRTFCYWNVEIRHPATQIEQMPPPKTGPSAPTHRPKDLPFRRRGRTPTGDGSQG